MESKHVENRAAFALEAVLRRSRQRRLLRRGIAMLSAVTILLTFGVTKYDADTLERIPMCGIEGHAHTDACYQQRPNPELLPEAETVEVEEAHEDADTAAEQVDDDVEEQGDLDLENLLEALPEDALTIDTYDEAPSEPEYRVGRQNPVLLSRILAETGLEVGVVEEVGQALEADNSPALIRVERQDGDFAIYVLDSFDALELAIFGEDDIALVKLTDAEVELPEATEVPTAEPTVEPTTEPTPEPTLEPTEEPTAEPTLEPTEEPTGEPTEAPGEASSEETDETPAKEATEEATDDTREENGEESGEKNEEETDEVSEEEAEEAPAEETEEEATEEAEDESEEETEEADEEESDGKAEEAASEEADGMTALNLGMAVISSADGETLPADAVGHAAVLTGSEAEDALSAVEDYLAAQPRSMMMRAMKAARTPGAAASETRYRVFEIGLENVDEEAHDFHVEVALDAPIQGRDYRLFHIHEGEVSEIDDFEKTLLPDGDREYLTDFAFDTENFSTFVLSYTVDFHYSVNGAQFDFSIPGGGAIALSDIVEALGIVSPDESAEFDAAWAFVQDVVYARFSAPELVCIAWVEEDTTAGEMTDRLGLEPAYSPDLTDADIESLKAAPLRAGDWVLFSLKPFSSEESLTLALEDGSEITIQVTDELKANRFTLTETVTGSAFDSQSGRGYDNSAKDNIVRSFDSVYYTTQIELQGDEKSDVFYEFKVEDSDELTLNLGSMSWCTLEETRRVTENGKDYKVFLLKTRDEAEAHSVVEQNFELQVGHLLEGYTFTPQITAYTESNPDTRLTVNSETIKVTTRPAFNVQLDVVRALTVPNEYPMEGDNRQVGMRATFAFAVQMRPEAENGNLKGLELPDKDTEISFDIDLSSVYRVTGSDENEDQDIDSAQFPILLYHQEENGASSNTDHKLPASSQNNTVDAASTGIVYQNGNVVITQSADHKTLHVTIRGFDVDTDQFPTTGVDSSASFLNSDGSLGIGIISTFCFDLLQTTKWNGNDLQTKYGGGSLNGTVELNTEVRNLSMKSETGVEVTTESKSDDNRKSTNQTLYGGNALYNHEIYFSRPGSPNSGTDDQNKINGSDSAVIGSKVYFTVRFNQSNVGTENEGGRVLAYHQLIKFDDAVFEADSAYADKNGFVAAPGNNQDWQETYIQYVGKTDGWDHKGLEPWQAGYDQEMKDAKEEDDNLHYFNSLDELKNKGYTCVGLLLKCIGCLPGSEPNQAVGFQYFLNVKSGSTKQQIDDLLRRDEEGNVIGSYMITMSTNAWNVNDMGGVDELRSQSQGTEYANWSDYTMLSRWATNHADQFTLEHHHSGDVDWDDTYRKNHYDASGYLADGTANFIEGDTLYLVPYETKVNKNVAQMSGDQAKNSFNLDDYQRYVDFRIDAKMEFSSNVSVSFDGNWTTTVVYSDTLPDNVTYVPGSAVVEGEYTPEHGNYEEKTPGRGSVTGGRRIRPRVSTDENGHTVLTFEIPNVTVTNGNIPALYYSCVIGNMENPDLDAKNNQNFTNTVTVQTTDDRREIKEANGNIATASFSVIKGSKFNIQKFGTDSIELDGTSRFLLYINNSVSAAQNNLHAIDFMPRDMKGKYEIKSLKLYKAGLGNTEGRDIEIHYTTNAEDLKKEDNTIQLAEKVSYEEVCRWQTATMRETESYYEISGTDLIGGWPLAIAYTDSQLPGNTVVRIEMEYEGNCGRVEDTLENTFSTHSLHTSATADVYARDLSGTAWFDEDLDGAIDGDEAKLEGVTVKLYKLDADGSIEDAGNPYMTTTTDANGYYSFGVPENIPSEWDEQDIKDHILRAGDYAIVFSGEGLEVFDDVTEKEARGVAAAVNSKADALKNDDSQLKGAIIRRVHMMTIDEMKADTDAALSHRQSVPDQNAGFVVTTEMNFTKQWHDVAGNGMNWPEDQDITLTLERALGNVEDSAFKGEDYPLVVGVDGMAEGVKLGAYTVNVTVTKAVDAGAYTVSITGLPGRDRANTGSYAWYVKEASIPDYGIAYPEQAERVGNGDTLVNYVIGYVLPSTGGVGTRLYRACGIILIAIALMLMLARRGYRKS